MRPRECPVPAVTPRRRSLHRRRTADARGAGSGMMGGVQNPPTPAAIDTAAASHSVASSADAHEKQLAGPAANDDGDARPSRDDGRRSAAEAKLRCSPAAGAFGTGAHDRCGAD